MGPRKTTTRERLISTAAELFRRQGYAQTGVNQIIQEAGATSGSFYHFFPAKEDLLLAVVDHIAGVFETEIYAAAADRTEEPLDELFEILTLYRKQLEQSGFAFASPMVALSAEVSENHPQVRARLAEIFAQWRGHIEDLLESAGERLPTTPDRAALAELILCATEGAVLGTRLNRSLEPFDSILSQLRSFFDLLGARKPELASRAVTPRLQRAAPSHSADWRSW